MHTVPPKLAPFAFSDEPLNFGEPASVQCTVLGGDSPLSIKWAFDGEPISHELGVTITRITKHIHVLAIEAVNADHSGNYTCIAQNNAGTITYTTQLIVNGLFLSETRLGFFML